MWLKFDLFSKDISMPFSYTSYGLRISSTLAFPELQTIDVDYGLMDVWVKHGVCELPPEIKEREKFFQLDENLAFWHRRGIGGLTIKNGHEIIIEAAPGVADSLLRPFVLGVGLAFLLYQRGFFILHSSSVAWWDGSQFSHGVGFTGYSTSGKSTMAAALHKRNHCALSDDLIALRLDSQPTDKESGEDPKPLIYPGHLHIKLRSPSVKAFGETTESLLTWNPNFESYLFQFPERTLTGPLPLRCLYALEEGDEVKIEPLDPHESLMKLVNNSFCVRALPTADANREFLQCAQLARQVPLFRLRRPFDFDRLTEVLDAVEEHQRQFLNANVTQNP